MPRRTPYACAAIALALVAIRPCPNVHGQELERTPFAAASKASGAALFTRLDPAETNVVVDNAYDDPEMWGRRYREYMGGSMGSGIAAGDFDADGFVDFYVSTKTKPGRLFRNLGGWTFEDVTEEAGLSEEGSFFSWIASAVSSDEEIVWRHGAVFADVNNDTLLDLHVSRNGAPNFMYINQGDGTFEEEAEERGLDLADGSVIGAFADYDRDGWLDVLVLTNQVDGTEPDGRADRLFRNTGEGYFVETTELAGIAAVSFGHAALWFDYNGDRWPDFYIANDFAGPDYLYRNNGDGTFTDVIHEVAPHFSYSTMGIDTADVDNNGHIDLFLSDMAATSREKDRRRKPAASKEDLLKSGDRETVAPQYTRNTLLLNTGRDYFREAAPWAGIDATDWTWSVRFEDFDNDGWTDLHVTNGMVREANNSDILSRMMMARSAAQRIGVMRQSPRLEESNLAFRNRGGAGFEDVTKNWGLVDVGVSFGAATADFDNDGDLDLVYLDHGGGVAVYRNDAANQRRIQVRLRGNPSNRFGVGAVVRVETGGVTQSRTLSTTRGYASGSELVAHFGLGPHGRVDRLTIEWPSGREQTFADLEADFAYVAQEGGEAAPSEARHSPALFAEKAEAKGLALMDESRPEIPDTEQALIPFRTDRRGPGVAVGDVDGDGHDDLYIAATTGSPSRILRWQDGRYIEQAPDGIERSSVEEGPPLFLDVDGNGSSDLLVTRASAKAREWPKAFQPVLYANDGYGNFTKTNLLPGLSINAGAICAADIDSDGDLDLFIGARSLPGRYPETPRSALLLREGGRFEDASERSPELAGVGLVKSVLFSDVDRDGKPDLLVALEWDFVRYFHNEGDGAFADWTVQAGFDSGGKGWWNGLASADFNGDGRMDFAVGNLGLNTTYRASEHEPATILYGSFGQSGPKLLVETVYDRGVRFPLRARGDLGARLAGVLRKYPKSDDYARANLVEVFGEKALEEADRFVADNFASGVFLSQPDESYQYAAFPRVAQIGPLQGIVASDFNADGFQDIVATQNTDIATPNFHGGVGLFLAGKGDGRFEPWEPSRSGVLVPGNANALALLDSDNSAKPDLFLTRHGGRTAFLENSAPSERWVKIVLSGQGQNADAVGARVEVAFISGAQATYETTLGGGWLSQSAPHVIVATPDGERIERAVVTWPTGQRTAHADPPSGGVWKIRLQDMP